MTSLRDVHALPSRFQTEVDVGRSHYVRTLRSASHLLAAPYCREASLPYPAVPPARMALIGPCCRQLHAYSLGTSPASPDFPLVDLSVSDDGPGWRLVFDRDDRPLKARMEFDMAIWEGRG
jgi:hypothetical protein